MSKNLAEEVKNTTALIQKGLNTPKPWLVENRTTTFQNNNSVNNIPSYVAAFNPRPAKPISTQSTVNFGKTSPNISNSYKPILDMIAATEGTAGYSQEYDVIVGFNLIPNWTPNYNQGHPNKRIYIPSIKDYSTAAGRYQFLKSSWDIYGKGLKFDKNGQDQAAYKLLKERIPQNVADNAYNIAKNQTNVYENSAFLQIINKIAPIWASVPQSSGKTYYGNQPARYTPQEVYNYYRKALSLYGIV